MTKCQRLLLTILQTSLIHALPHSHNVRAELEVDGLPINDLLIHLADTPSTAQPVTATIFAAGVDAATAEASSKSGAAGTYQVTKVDQPKSASPTAVLFDPAPKSETSSKSSAKVEAISVALTPSSSAKAAVSASSVKAVIPEAVSSSSAKAVTSSTSLAAPVSIAPLASTSSSSKAGLTAVEAKSATSLAEPAAAAPLSSSSSSATGLPATEATRAASESSSTSTHSRVHHKSKSHSSSTLSKSSTMLAVPANASLPTTSRSVHAHAALSTASSSGSSSLVSSSSVTRRHRHRSSSSSSSAALSSPSSLSLSSSSKKHPHKMHSSSSSSSESLSSSSHSPRSHSSRSHSSTSSSSLSSSSKSHSSRSHSSTPSSSVSHSWRSHSTRSHSSKSSSSSSSSSKKHSRSRRLSSTVSGTSTELRPTGESAMEVAGGPDYVTKTITTTIHEPHTSTMTMSDGRSTTIYTSTRTITITKTVTIPRSATSTAARSTGLPAGQDGTAVGQAAPMATLTQVDSETNYVSTTVITVELKTTLKTSTTQTPTVSGKKHTSGSVNTALPTDNGNPSIIPFATSDISTPASKISLLAVDATAVIKPHTKAKVTAMATGNIFQAVAKGAPPAQISSRGDHPVPRQGLSKSGPIETNKFYSNFFLGTRNASAFTFPYSISWAAGQGATGSWGLAVEHVSRAQTGYGPGSPAAYYVNPLGLQSIILSARELGKSTQLSVTNPTGFSAKINLTPVTRTSPIITFPLVQGMGMFTGIYSAGTPSLASSISFLSLTYSGVVGSSTTVRYTVQLGDQVTWFIYITPAAGSTVIPTLTLASPQQIIGNKQFTGLIQVAKAPITGTVAAAQSNYDQTAGTYATDTTLTGTASGTAGTYTMTYKRGGLTAPKLLMFALPHHVVAFSTATRNAMVQSFQLQTTTKGMGTAVFANSWTMEETLPTSMGFAPWDITTGAMHSLSPSAVQAINSAAATELAQDMQAQTDLNSMYFAGKALAKFAQIVYATNTLGKNTAVASAGLAKLKVQFSRFVNNTQIYPLVYDSAWGGIVSSASYVTGDSGVDFGNSYYNDHHFHYGYFVYAAAIIGTLDPTWLNQGTNKAWVNTLIRDYANPVSDGYLPFSRMFDWYHGHSWAAGLFESFDGKNQESSSEDSMASYAIKMWGQTVGDGNMEARGNLMLAIQTRSFNNYYLMQDNNVVQPPKFIANKAVGILFENKVDHTTYFGTNIEYIEGIHMLPLLPSSALTRKKSFVTQEWNTYFSNGRADAVAGGWRGVLYANYALINPSAAYNFFAQSGFNNDWLDGGASRTWYLAYAAGLGGAA